jgi:ABC-type polysaccharide/polyol phosphate transport system ATPase subunit
MSAGVSIEPAGAADVVAASAPGADAPVVIEARGVEKAFRIPSHRITSFKERAVHPFARMEYRQLHALRGISFDIRRGEFFGIVGRNGSGKSTLLKILASIYRADAGTVRMGGRPAPFIELGVGFNQELSARENVVLNGVMMGLPQREARRRLDAVLDFAELEEFVDLKLKNYSSGMMVRLAFSVMLQAEAEILLIDEVLAVGDAAFQQKCRDEFHRMRDAGRTIVLVTHDMSTVQAFCHRAMLLHEGELAYIGDPEEAGRRYFRLNFEEGGTDEGGEQRVRAVPDLNARVIDAWLEDGDGERITNVELAQPIRLNIVLEASRDLDSPVFVFHFTNADGVHVFGFKRTLDTGEGKPDRVDNGNRVRISGTIENPLAPGRYFVTCWIGRDREPGDIALQVLRPLDFVVFGSRETGEGLVALDADVEAVPEEGNRR